jgi:L-amino acid N-acyltransferase YncA
MSIQIRLAVPADAAGMVEVLNPIIETRAHSAYITPRSVGEQQRALEDRHPRALIHVAVDEAGELVGWQKVAPLADDVRSFDHVATMETFVRIGRHKQGIGSALFAASFMAAKSAGYEKICTFVRADNDAGLRAYLGQGFTECGRSARQAKIDGTYVDEVIIERFL